jgi:hypothetical protein
MHYPPVSEALSAQPVAARYLSSVWRLSASDLCTIIERLLRQDQYWVAEAVLKVLFLTNFGLSRQYSPSYDMLQKACVSIQWFVKGPLIDEEQERWARIAIQQTFCEGMLGISPPTAKSGVACDWSGPKIILLLRDLLHEALAHDKTGDWLHSRASIRYRLLDFDNNMAKNYERRDVVWSRRMFEDLLQLCEDAEDNQDFMMESSIHWRIQTLGYGKGPKAIADPSLIPLKVYAQRERSLAEMRGSRYGRLSVEGIEWWPSPIKPLRNDGQEGHSHKGTTNNEQGFPGGASKQKEVVPVETAAPGETLPALLEIEREANRDL